MSLGRSNELIIEHDEWDHVNGNFKTKNVRSSLYGLDFCVVAMLSLAQNA